MTEEEKLLLKPCPFCGSKALIVDTFGGLNGRPQVYVMCSNPDCHIKGKEVSSETKKEERRPKAIEFWGTRATQPNEPLSLEQMKERNSPVWCHVPELPDGGCWCLCQQELITPPSCMPFMAKDRPEWVFYDRPPKMD